MNSWSHIHMEAYCLHTKEGENEEIKRPGWCTKKFKDGHKAPSIRCLAGHGKTLTRCPFFAFTDVSKEDNELFDAIYWVRTQCFEDEHGNKIKGRKKAVIKELVKIVDKLGRGD